MATMPFALPPPGAMAPQLQPMLPPPQPSLQPAVVDYREAHPHRPPASHRVQAVLQQARERWTLREEVEGRWLRDFERDTNYAAGKQWEDTVVAQRVYPNGTPRITVTLNRYPRALHAVQNEERQQRPSIQVSPVDSGADKDTAKALQGMLRHIEYDSNGEDAEDTAFMSMTRGGKGFQRIVTEYEDELSFRQVLKVKRVTDPRCVFLDPTARCDLDYHTMTWAFVIERQRKAFVKERYEITESEWQGWASHGGAWVSKDECLVADYYCKEELPITLVEVSPGLIRYVPRLVQTDDETEQQRQQELLGAVTSRLALRQVYPIQAEEVPWLQSGHVRTRQSYVSVVWWYKINGVAILESMLWPGKDIPIIPVLGEEFDLGDGGTDYQGLVRNGIGAQDQFNYARSLTLETIAQGPKNPWVGAAGAFDGHPEWDTANIVPYSKLEYNPVDRYGQPTSPPFRQQAEPAIQAVTMLAAQTSQDFDDMLGVYPASWGEQGNEKSGIAIQQRRSAGSLGVSHFSLNATRARKRKCQLLIDLIPLVYHEWDRVVRILGEEMEQDMIQLQPGRGGPQTQPTPEAPLPEGIAGLYDPTAGRYDVVLQPGSSHATRQEETAAFLTELAQVAPQVGQLGADILVTAHGNFERQDELARRLKRSLPPQVLDPEDQQKPEDQVIMLQQQMMQAEQQLQQMQAMLQQVGQQAQETGQENEKLKLQLTAKHQDYQIDQAELVAQRQVDEAKMQVEREKLALERERFTFEQVKWQQEQAWRRYDAERQAQQEAEGPDKDEEGTA